jgi:uncharacterized protein YgbK (DUF1537 family)
MKEGSVTKIIVLDDDPTGAQTVHSCLLLTRWDSQTLIGALGDDSPLFFVLTNTRGMDADKAAVITRDVCININIAMEAFQRQTGVDITPILVSRSDSTLRGHYPVETNVIAEELGPFEAHFLIPAFFEGGRITRNSTHYLMVNGTAVPCHETEFARDSVFKYSTAYLPDYVEEKTKGAISADQVERFLLDDVRGDCLDRIRRLTGNVCCVVDCETQADLNHFANQLKQAAAETEHGRRYLFRSGASLLTALAQLPLQPVPASGMATYVSNNRPGAVLVGSHVQKTTDQLAHLLKLPQVEGIIVEVDRIPKESAAMLTDVTEQAEVIHLKGFHAVIYTSRKEITFPDQGSRLAFGEQVSGFLMEVVRGLPPTLGFLISKGGITSNDVLSDGLSLSTSRVLGQILPGCSVVRCPAEHDRYPGMPVIIFPGNVGDEKGLAMALQRLCAGLSSD